VAVEQTGVFFEDQDVDSLRLALATFIECESTFDSELIRQQALKFSRQRFLEEFRTTINRCYDDFQARISGDRVKHI